MAETVKVRVAVIAGLLLLAGCDDKSVDVGQADDTPNEVRLVAVAPDGTRLWKTRGIYFASSGTTWHETRTQWVPNGKGGGHMQTYVVTHRVPTAPTEPEVAASVEEK